MFKKMTRGCVKVVQNYLPDPFLFAVILTFIVYLLGIFTTNQTPMGMLLHWSGSFWNLLAFSMQMALVLVTGHTLASTAIIKKGLKNLAKKSKTPLQAIVAVTIVSTIACFINWGFGLVIGALYARQLAKEVKGVDYRLLIASAYSGFIVWHAGLSGSIPLKLATAGEGLAEATNGAVVDPVPTSLTIFSPFNLVIIAIILVSMPFINRAMHPAKEDVVTVDPALLEDEAEDDIIKHSNTFADKIENSSFMSMLIGLMGLVYIVYYFVNNGFKLNLNIVNFIFLFVAIILHRTPRKFLDAIIVATKGTAGIILQFPFYAGIMGMMVGQHPETGLSLRVLFLRDLLISPIKQHIHCLRS